MKIYKKIAVGMLGLLGVVSGVLANTPSSIISPATLDNLFPGIANRESPVRYIRGGNTFNGMFLWRDEEFLITPQIVNDGTTTYSCRAKLKGVYYNNQRGNRRRPLDEETRSMLASIDSSYNDITIQGGIFSFCDNMPSRNAVGQVTHIVDNNGPTYKLIGGGFTANLATNSYTFATIAQQNMSTWMTQGSLKGYRKNAFGFIYDSAGGLGEVCGGRGYNRYSQSGGTGQNKSGYAIVDRCLTEPGQQSGVVITPPDTSSGNVLSGGTILSGGISSGNILSGSIIQLPGGFILRGSGTLAGSGRIRNAAVRNGIITAPVSKPANDSNLSNIPGIANNRNKGIFKAGAEVGLEVIQGSIILSLPTNQTPGSALEIYRSDDGQTWTKSSPTDTCTIQSDKTCTFTTDHLSYFALTTQATVPGSNPGGSNRGTSNFNAAPVQNSGTTNTGTITPPTTKLCQYADIDYAGKGPFTDTLGHRGFDYIEILRISCLNQGRGVKKGLRIYEPNANITRAEVLKTISKILGSSFGNLEVTNEQNIYNGNKPFADTPNWFNHYADYAFKNGLTEGLYSVKDGKMYLDPDKAINRYEAIKIMMLAYNKINQSVVDISQPSVMGDVIDANNPYYSYVRQAEALGFISGVPKANGEYNFEGIRNLTRAEFAKIVGLPFADQLFEIDQVIYQSELYQKIIDALNTTTSNRKTFIQELFAQISELSEDTFIKKYKVPKKPFLKVLYETVVAPILGS